MVISMVVAVAANQVIGKNNQLIWHLPNDLKFFKNITWGMPVIMGRKTFDSLNGKPLTGRYNIIISRQSKPDEAPDTVRFVSSLEDALLAAKATECKEAFVIGGGEIYTQALPLAGKVYLTRVDVKPEGDAFFPELPEKNWKLVSKLDFPKDERHAYDYSLQVWDKI